MKQNVPYKCNDLEHELLLVADFLQATKCVVDFNKNEITILWRSISMIPKETQTVCRVGVAASTAMHSPAIYGKCKLQGREKQHR